MLIASSNDLVGAHTLTHQLGLQAWEIRAERCVTDTLRDLVLADCDADGSAICTAATATAMLLLQPYSRCLCRFHFCQVHTAQWLSLESFEEVLSQCRCRIPSHHVLYFLQLQKLGRGHIFAFLLPDRVDGQNRRLPTYLFVLGLQNPNNIEGNEGECEIAH